jgi:hypothetical protein
MKKVTVVAAVLMTVLVAAGCGKSAGDKAAEAYLAGMNDVATAIEKVEDEAGARKAAEVIGRVSKDMEKVSKDLEGLSEAEKNATEEKYGEDFAAAQKRIQSAMMKMITRPDLMTIIASEMEDMPRIQ